MEIYKKFIENDPITFSNNIENFEKNYLNKPNYTPEYKSKLDAIKKSLKKERQLNLNKNDNFWTKILDFDNLELKPNIAGVGINLNEIINKFKK